MVESVVTVGLEVVKCLAPPTERQIRYLRNYKSNLENLQTEIGKLKNERGSLQHAVDEAKRQGEDIEENVEDWLRSANNVIEEAEKFVDDEAAARCLKGLCPNLKTRLRRSKEAVRLQDAVVKLLGDRAFPRISYRTVQEDTVLMPDKYYETFVSRKTTLEKILSALRDPEVIMLGIYGMGGIGKTTLAKEAGWKAMIEKLFNQVVFVEVSQSHEQVRNVQGQIADKLGLSFSEESESGRARSLCGRLKKEEKILVILDNIWDKLDLLAVGVPHGDDHKGCKIMLTSRSEDTLLQKMDCERNIFVGVLEDDEAWILFKKLAGDHIESTVLKSVAKAVLDKCARLPVSIVTVARALRRNKSLAVWNDALEKLQRPSSSNFKDVQGEAFSAIELSYNMLPGEELKKVFLLIGCIQIRNVDDLAMYGMGMCLFEGINKLKEARDRVCSLVQRLKAACLLLEHESESQELFSMHDVIRDVAMSIAFRDQTAVTVTEDQFNQWEQRDEREAIPYTWIDFLDVNTSVLVQRLECPRLKLLSLRTKSWLRIPDHFFSGMKQMRVLDLMCINLIPMPSSIGFLTNLQTLCLHYWQLPDVGFLGGLKQLQILSLRGSNIRKLPVELGQLTRLMLLDLRRCYELQVIPPNVLSKLCHLEELYIGDFTNWAMKVEGVENASPEELMHLPNLTSLELRMAIEALPSGFFFEQLERCNILVGHFPPGYILRMPYIPKSLRYNKTFEMIVNGNIRLKDRLVMEQLRGIEDLSYINCKSKISSTFLLSYLKTALSR